MGVEVFRYDGKRALVVGGASGMGLATAKVAKDLGADVVVMDSRAVELDGLSVIEVDLRRRSSIDAALDRCGGPIHALFACAGVADGTPGLEQVNFIGHRHLIERAVNEGMMPKGSAIAMISSIGGGGWKKQLPLLFGFLDTPSFEAASQWILAHPGTATYQWSKEAICAYVARQAYPLLQKGIRINATMPGPTDTPLARADPEVWLGFGREFRKELGIEASSPEEQAYPLAFLCSDAARHINGISLVVDAGYVSAGITGTPLAGHGVETHRAV